MRKDTLAAQMRPYAALAPKAALAALAGLALELANFPAGWMCGAMAVSVALSLTGHGAKIPPLLRSFIFVALGISMGSGISPAVLANASAWPLSLALLAVSVIATMGASSLYLRKMHGWDSTTARLSSVPGALTAVLLMASEQRNGRFPDVAVAQIVRQIVLVACVPLLMVITPVTGDQSARTVAAPLDLGLLFVLGFAAGQICTKLKVPGGALIGPMVVSTLMHGAGLASGALPPVLQILALVLVGVLIGARVSMVDLSMLSRAILPALGAVLIAVLVAAGFAAVTHLMLGLPFVEVWLAYAPGGIEAMTVMAYTLNLDPSFVSVHHVLRLLGLMLLAPLWLRRTEKDPESPSSRRA
ncbi:AbrB family transcriptional regulator [Salipiger sp. CCB-MM3]|uniref:AbrB family transcriptional regulator n=1 Tax=Salipiger sp. CCB-MM3 TaxID=1792508 RepID=UPI0009F450B0|nr:AbrB family transcriptional regulator [Salipiger sp. CCB-MM3]